jgi:predicted phosphodiesterase
MSTNELKISIFSDLHQEFDNKKTYVFQCNNCGQNYSMVYKKNKYNNAKCSCGKSSVRFQNKSDNYYLTNCQIIDCYKDNGYPEYLREKNIDIIIANGDIHYGILGVMALKKYSPIPVFYIPGNHEFYTDDINQTRTSILNDMRSFAQNSNVIILDRDSYDISIRDQNVRILGATLWTDYQSICSHKITGEKFTQEENMEKAKINMNDYNYIYGKPGINITPEELLNENQLSRQWFANEFEKANKEGIYTIMVTHHPSLLIGLGKHKGQENAPFYVNDMSSEINEWQPNIVVWGHTHQPMTTRQDEDKQILCISSPRGYPKEYKDNWMPNIFDIDFEIELENKEKDNNVRKSI